MKTSSQFLVASTFPAVGTAFAFWTAASSGFSSSVSAAPTAVGFVAFVFLLVAGFGANWAEVDAKREPSDAEAGS